MEQTFFHNEFGQVPPLIREIPNVAITVNSPCFPIPQDMQQAILKYGSSAFSFDVFESPASYRWFPFAGSHGPGGIAFKEACRTRVIVGDPLLHEEDWADALTAFLTAKGRPFTVTMATFASTAFVKVALETNGAAIEAQTAVSLNPQKWEPLGPKTARIRQYSRKCEKQGLVLVKMRNEKEPEPAFRVAAENLIVDWQQNSLKRFGNVHDVNLWEACKYKQYFALIDPKTNEFHALVVARPLPASQGFYLWTARASRCLTGALEATIAGTIRSMREDGVTYLTFGPLQAVRPHIYVDKSGGTRLGRWVLGKLVAEGIKRAGYHHTMNFFKKFDFEQSENIHNLIWPRRSWIRPYAALNKLFTAKRKTFKR